MKYLFMTGLSIALLLVGCGSGPGGGAENEIEQTTRSLGTSATGISELPRRVLGPGEGSIPSHAVIAFSPSNPVAGEVLTLDATATTPGIADYPMIFGWDVLSRPEGSTARLAHGVGPLTYFVPDVPGTYVIHLDVDQDIAPGLATADIDVGPAPPGQAAQPELPRQLTPLEEMTSPVAVVEFSPAQPSVGSVVELDGTKTRPAIPDVPLFYDWEMVSRPSGSNAVIDGRSDAAASFVPDRPGDYTIFFTATHDSASAMILGTIHVR